MGTKHLGVPYASEAPDRQCVDDPTPYRLDLAQMRRPHLERFPNALSEGLTFHDHDQLVKQDLVSRRLKLKAGGKVWAVRPSWVRPDLWARDVVFHEDDSRVRIGHAAEKWICADQFSTLSAAYPACPSPVPVHLQPRPCYIRGHDTTGHTQRCRGDDSLARPC